MANYFYDFGENNNLYVNRYVIFKNAKPPSNSHLYFCRANLIVKISNNELTVLKDKFSEMSNRPLTEEDKEEFLVKVLSAMVI